MPTEANGILGTDFILAYDVQLNFGKREINLEIEPNLGYYSLEGEERETIGQSLHVVLTAFSTTDNHPVKSKRKLKRNVKKTTRNEERPKRREPRETVAKRFLRVDKGVNDLQTRQAKAHMTSQNSCDTRCKSRSQGKAMLANQSDKQTSESQAASIRALD